MKLDIQLFASSKTITKTIKDSYNNSYTVTATINESIPDDYISTNKTLVSGSVKVSNTGNGGAYTSSKSMSATMSFLAENSSGATLASATGSCAFNFDGSATKTATPLTYSNLEITHNTDGSRTVYIKLILKITETSLKQTQTYTDTLALTTIPRASQPTLSSSSVNMGSSVTITTNRASDNFTHKLTYSFGSLTNQTSGLGASTNVGASTTFTPPLTLANQVPNATSGTCTITCQTYNGSTLIGTKTVTLTLNVPSSVVPTVSIGTLVEAGSTPSSWGVFVQNKSKLSIPITTSGSYGSTISTISTTANGSTYSTTSITTGVLTTVGTNTINTTVKDSRNRTSSASKTFTVVAYSNPTITTADVIRVNSSNVEDDEGTYISYKFVGSISPVSNKNAKTFRIGYRTKGSTGAYTYKNISTSYSVNVTSYTRITDSGWTFDTNTSYEIVFEAIDSFNTSSNPIKIKKEISSGFDLMNFDASGKAMAFGKVSEAGSSEELLEVALPTKHTSNIVLEKSTGETYYRAKRTDTGVAVDLMVGSSGTNRGIYDRTNSKWMTYTDGTNVYLGTATVGSTNRPIYLSSGKPTQCNTPSSGAYFRGVPEVDSSGVMEVGRYIDFHPTTDSTLNYSKRIDAGTGTTARVLSLPDKTGTLACTSDIPNVSPNIMKARPSSNISISSTGNKKITLATNDFQNGSNLSISSGGIKIGAGITKVKVSGTVYFSAGTNAGDSLRCVIYKNDTIVAENYGRAGTTGTYETRSIIPTPITVAQNDIIYLYYSNATAGRGTISSSAADTYLIVEQIL